MLQSANVGGNVYGGRALDGDANNNTVLIGSGTVHTGTEIYGGWTSKNGGNARENHVYLESGASLNPLVSIYGGMPGPGGISSGNKLVVMGYRGTVRNLQYFQAYDFYLDPAIANGDAILRVTGIGPNMNDAESVDLYVVGGMSLKEGDRVILIDNVTGTYDKKVQALGGSYTYAFDVLTENGALLAILGGREVNTGATHNQLMASSAGVILANGGADALIEAMGAFQPRADKENASGVEFGAFAYTGGGRYKVSTGSHVKTDNFHVMTGPGVRITSDKGQTSLGAFFEAGWGDYDTKNSFGGHAYRGSGDTEYQGGGLLLRHDHTSGVYGEAAVRIGRLKSEYDAKWAHASHDTSTLYAGGHVGAGYKVPVWEDGTMDFSARLLWTHVDSTHFTNSEDERFSIDATDSVRHQLGATYTHTFLPGLSAFAGAAWEYEYDGKTKGTMDGERIPASRLEGHTGIGRIGLSYSPTDNITLDLAGHGLVGTREGGGGSLNLRFEF